MKSTGIGLAAAATLGLAIAWVDSRPGWDSTGISAGLIFIACALLAPANLGRAALTAAAVGIWIPLYETFWIHNYGAWLALVPALLGGLLGAGVRSMVTTPPSRA